MELGPLGARTTNHCPTRSQYLGKDLEWLQSELGENPHLNRRDDLRGKDFRWATITHADGRGGSLDGYHLNGTDLRGWDETAWILGDEILPKGTDIFELPLYTRLALSLRSYTDLRSANLLGAELRNAQLEYVDLRVALLIAVDFSDASLKDADLYGADLRWAVMTRTDLSGADLGNTNLEGLQYEPLSNAQPSLASLATAKNVWKMRYNDDPAGLTELRNSLKQAGFTELSRQVTFAIRHTERATASRGSVSDRVGSLFSLVFFEWPTAYGMHPGRALLILLTLIPVGVVPYYAALSRRGRGAIWASRPEWTTRHYRFSRRIRLGQPLPGDGSWRSKLYHLVSLLRIAIYFSILSAFRIGFREVNVGTWIERLQSREYTLSATGWVRTVSGVQSLSSLFPLGDVHIDVLRTAV